MERCLCLLIGKEPLPGGVNCLKLTKPVDKPNKLDAYTMNHFSNSEEVREYFKEEIEKYLEKNQKIISDIKNKTGRNYRGSIAIVEEKNNHFRKLRVLYSDTCSQIKNLLNDIVFMQRLALEDEMCEGKYMKLFSPYEIDVILSRNGQDYPWKEVKKILHSWKERLKIDFYGTDKIRLVLKRYEEFQKEVKVHKVLKKK